MTIQEKQPHDIQYDLIIIGAGLAGLSAAMHAHKHDKSFIVLEANANVGGRVATSVVDGYTIDHGFQVFLTSYPEAEALLDYDALELKPFLKGARIRKNGQFHTVLDPLAHPWQALSSATTPIREISDKVHIPFFVNNVKKENWLEHFEANSPFTPQSTLQHLEQLGFSDAMIDDFFKPFFSGVFLENELSTPAQQFRFLFDMFAKGEATLPQKGMQAIPEQMKNTLPENSVHCNQRVQSIQKNSTQHWDVLTQSGERYSGNTVIISTPAHQQPQIDGVTLPNTPTPTWKATTCYYFSADASPLTKPVLVLNAEAPEANVTDPINSVTVPTLLQPSYAPKGKHLISVSTLGCNPDTPSDYLTTQLTNWFGKQATSWTHITTQVIKHALPLLTGDTLAEQANTTSHLKLAEGLYQCGDATTNPSINGAMASGRLVIEAIAADVKEAVLT